MKSKFHFDPEDFGGCGQMIIRQSCSVNSTDLSFMASVSYKVGWISRVGPNKIILIALTDGMVREYESTKELCDELNGDTHGYRPMSKEEITKVATYVGSRFAGW